MARRSPREIALYIGDGSVVVPPTVATALLGRHTTSLRLFYQPDSGPRDLFVQLTGTREHVRAVQTSRLSMLKFGSRALRQLARRYDSNLLRHGIDSIALYDNVLQVQANNEPTFKGGAFSRETVARRYADAIIVFLRFVRAHWPDAVIRITVEQSVHTTLASNARLVDPNAQFVDSATPVPTKEAVP